jgi:hypothetical protein
MIEQISAPLEESCPSRLQKSTAVGINETEPTGARNEIGNGALLED